MGLLMLATCVHHQSFGNAHYYIYYIYEECSQVDSGRERNIFKCIVFYWHQSDRRPNKGLLATCLHCTGGAGQNMVGTGN